jgi:hypothetical protein
MTDKKTSTATSGENEKGQLASMPSSTACCGNNARFLCWNLNGVVTSRPGEPGATVEAKLADVARKGVYFVDKDNLSLAALGDESCFFASTPADDGDGRSSGSMLHYNQLGGESAPGGVQQWTRHLGPGEQACCVAVGAGWCCCVTGGATGTGLVRVYDSGGVETDVFFSPGPVLSAVGRGHALFLAYQGCGDAPQALCAVYDVLSRAALVAPGCPLPVPPGGRVAWVGMSEPEGMPCVMDGRGVLSGLKAGFGGVWVPLLDTRPLVGPLSSETYWPIGVQNSTLLACVVKGEATEPAVFRQPRAVTTALSDPGSYNSRH